MADEVIVYWLATSESEIHYIDAIISAYDGLATVRREFKIADGDTYYRVFVSAGMEEEFIEVLERLRSSADIRDVRRGEL